MSRDYSCFDCVCKVDGEEKNPYRPETDGECKYYSRDERRYN